MVVAKCEIKVTGGLSAVEGVGCANIRFPVEEQELVDVKFVDDTVLILLLRNPGMVSFQVNEVY